MLPSTQSVLDAMDGITYLVDRHLRLAAIGKPNWVRFALDNDAPDLADTALLLGRPLPEFIVGDKVHTLYTSLFFSLAGRPGSSVSLRYRCDGPSCRRLMSLAVSSMARGRLGPSFLVQSQVMEAVQRAPVPLFDPTRWEGVPELPLLSICSVCERVCHPAGCTTEDACEWMEAEDYYARGGAPAVRLSHTVCPSCFAGWTAAFAPQGAGGVSPRGAV